jgi:hypothetical protein
VVSGHLDPEHQSEMTRILAARTKMHQGMTVSNTRDATYQ